MTIPKTAVTVALAPEHWLRIEKALWAAEAQLHRTGNSKHGWRYHHTRQLIQHVTDGWDKPEGMEVPYAWEAQQ